MLLRKLPWFFLAIVWVVLDLYTKHLAVIELKEKVRYIDVLPILRWFYAENHGAAFSFLAGQGGWQKWFFIIVGVSAVVGLSFVIIKAKNISFWANLGYSSILGGAIGNVYDRATLGYVRDMISVYYEPANFYFAVFNVADVAISVGVIALLIDWLLSFKKQR